MRFSSKKLPKEGIIRFAWIPTWAWNKEGRQEIVWLENIRVKEYQNLKGGLTYNEIIE